MDNSTGEIIDALNITLAKMATKDDFASFRAEMREEFVSVRADIRALRDEIHARLDAIDAKLKDHRGYAKDIQRLFAPLLPSSSSGSNAGLPHDL